MKLTFRDKHEQRDKQIIMMETTRSKQMSVETVVSWGPVLVHTT
jgi:hypothetical protein